MKVQQKGKRSIMMGVNLFVRGMAVLVWLVLASPVPAQTGSLKSEDLCLGGKAGAPVRVEVFSDYQCPSCRGFYLETIRPLLKEYGQDNKVCVIYYEFPLNIHKFAFEASRYAIAAGRLGKDQRLRVMAALYENQSRWAGDGKIEAVVEGALSAEEMDNVRKLLKDPSIDQNVHQDIKLADERRVNSTPTFFIYAQGRSQKVVGKISYPVLKDYLNRMFK